MIAPISFLLGAGASFPYGVPMMGEFYSRFRDHLARRHPSCFDLFEQFEANTGHPARDLETLMSDLQTVLALPTGMSILGKSDHYVEEHVQVARELRGYLDAFIVDECERFDRVRVANDLEPLLRLRDLGQLWIFSTNYDRIVEHACKEASVAYSDGFSSDLGSAVADWTGRFEDEVSVVKLHGSVNWYEDDPGGDLHRLDRGYSLPAYDFRLTRGAQTLRPLLIIPTLEKQALQQPYVTLATLFTDLLKETRLLVVCGNSLRDRHIRGFIQTRLNRIHVLVVNPAADQTLALFAAQNRIHCLSLGFSEFVRSSATALVELGEQLSDGALTDAQVGSAVGNFVEKVRADATADTSLQSDPVLASLTNALRHPSAAVRLETVDELGTSSHQAVPRKLEVLLDGDPSPEVRAACIAPLIRIVGAGAVTPLISLLQNDTAPVVRREAILGLRKLSHDERAVEALRRAAGDATEDPVVQEIARSA